MTYVVLEQRAKIYGYGMTGGCVFDRRIFINYLLNYPVSYISAKKNDPRYLDNLSTTKNGNIKVFDEDTYFFSH